MSEIYIEQISTERAVYFENEYLGEIPAGYYNCFQREILNIEKSKNLKILRKAGFI